MARPGRRRHRRYRDHRRIRARRAVDSVQAALRARLPLARARRLLSVAHGARTSLRVRPLRFDPTIGLGLGAAAAILATADAALVEPLPYARPERLVHLWELRAGTDERSP